jgi:hypothetical protein
MEFSKLLVDFTAKLPIDYDCSYCLKNTKD